MVFIVLIGRSKGLENETRHNDNDTEKRNEERNRVTVETSEEETNEDSNERRSEESNGGKHKECIKSTEGMNEEDSETKEHMNQEVNGDRNGGEEAKSDDVCDTKKDGSSDKEGKYSKSHCSCVGHLMYSNFGVPIPNLAFVFY